MLKTRKVDFVQLKYIQSKRSIFYNKVIVWADTVHNYQHHDRVKKDDFYENQQKSDFFIHI